MGLANWLTIARILLVPVLVICLVYNRALLALSTFIVAGVTDMMDGYIARTRGSKTRLGAFLDPPGRQAPPDGLVRDAHVQVPEGAAVLADCHRAEP